MKIVLDQKLIEQFSLENKPIKQEEWGDLLFAKKPAKTPYIVYDAHSNAPVGFGVKIGSASKTYIIQRNIDGRVLKIRVGKVNDFETTTEARTKARQLIQEAIETKANPNLSRMKKTLTGQALEKRLEELLELHMGKFRLRSEMAKLHDDTVIDNVTAAIYLDVSKSTLSYWRQTGMGPAYIRYIEQRAANQYIHYKLGELRRFLKEGTKK